jgi:uncharacterized protein YjbJ (UPF0337 family)
MNWDGVQCNWTRLTGRVQQRWGRLTDNHLHVIAGRREILVTKIQEQYGVTNEVADHLIDDWVETLRESYFANTR